MSCKNASGDGVMQHERRRTSAAPRTVSGAVHGILAASAAAAFCVAPPTKAQDQDQSAASDQSVEVVVTGSRIRRVDLETASPVFVLDASDIAASGVTSIGELVQRIPAISGAATNPQVNNGGGTGESNVELRGLGAERTLVLINGHRIGVLGRLTSAVDVNLIPVNLIDRVEILKEGAGAVYGSDAIAGVLNFITRTDIDGAELGFEYGRTGESDGERQAVNLSYGARTDRLNFLIGGNWHKQEEISAGDRDFSAFATYLFSGESVRAGSSRTPSGRIDLPDSLLAQYGGCADTGSVTRSAGSSGTGVGDYRCFDNVSDRYNFQPVNLVLTPQERASLFTTASFEVNDDVESYLDVLYNRTQSRFQIAPLAFDAQADDVIISADSFYNPFGIDFGGIAGANPNALFRLEAIGTRAAESRTDSMHMRAGLRGDVGFSDWRWDLAASFGTHDQNNNTGGYLYKPALAGAAGPSGLDAAGNVVCGRRDPSTGIVPAANIIPNCTPVNFFNLADPAQVAGLATISTSYLDEYKYRSKEANLAVDGSVFELPAGPVQLAAGLDYRDVSGKFETDFLTQSAPPLFLTCLLAGETCTGDTSAAYDVKEAYAEFFVPLLKDRPGARALNLSAGVRYSDYSTFGNTTNSQFKLEYRPISDLLLRGSFAEVFRAPTITDLARAPTANAPTFTDPCAGLTAAQVSGNPNYALACIGVPTDGSFAQPNAQIGSVRLGNPNLNPETGDVTTFGFVYDPSQVRGLSVTVDLWRYKIDDTIVLLDPNFAITQCVATGAPQFCNLVVRFDGGPSSGLIQQFFEPTFNLGSLETNGLDVGARYTIRDTRLGAFRFSVDMTRINSFENIPAPGAEPVEVVGTYNRQYGNYAKWRGIGAAGWSWQSFEGIISARYIHSLELLNPDGIIQDAPPLQLPSVTYLDLTLGYKLGEKTKFQLGVVNLTDKSPPILFQNNVINSNTDVSTYDTIGRRFWISATHSF